MVDRSQNRSGHYQHVIIETATPPDKLTEIAERDSTAALLNPWEYNENLLELKEQLREEFWRLCEEKLTDRQLEVIKLCAEGLTQTMIAKKLKVNQSSITKSINGNCDYKNGRKCYGGTRRKLSKLISQDPEIQIILAKIKEELED